MDDKMEQENPTPNVIPFPHITLIKGLAEVAFHAIFDQFRHISSSEHFITDAVDREDHD